MKNDTLSLWARPTIRWKLDEKCPTNPQPSILEDIQTDNWKNWVPKEGPYNMLFCAFLAVIILMGIAGSAPIFLENDCYDKINYVNFVPMGIYLVLLILVLKPYLIPNSDIG